MTWEPWPMPPMSPEEKERPNLVRRSTEILRQVEAFRALHKKHDLSPWQPFDLGIVPEIECYTCNEKFSFRPPKEPPPERPEEGVI